MNGLSTNAGQNAKGFFEMALGAIVMMEGSHEKSILMGICLICMALVSFRTKGSGITPEQGQEILSTAEEIKEVLGEGRK
jgi:hypothetical protein